MFMMWVFLFKQNTAYEMRISDWSSDLCSADLDGAVHVGLAIDGVATIGAVALPGLDGGLVLRSDAALALPASAAIPRLLVSRTRPAAEAVEIGRASCRDRVCQYV